MSGRRPRVERRLIVVSKCRTPTDEGLGRLVAALVLHNLAQQQGDGGTPADDNPPPELGAAS